MSVTFNASANATPASGIIVATCTIGGEEYQLAILAGTDGQPFGLSTSPLHVAVTNIASAVISSGSVVVTNALSASISGGSVALLAGANIFGSASAIQSTPTGSGNAWPIRLTDLTNNAVIDSASRLLTAASIVNTASVIINSGSVTVTNQVSASISNIASVVVSSGSVVVTNALSASISGGSVAILAGANIMGSASVIQSTPTGSANAWPVRLTDLTNNAVWDSASRLLTAASIVNTASVIVNSGSVTVTNQVSASISNIASVVVSSGSVVVTNALSASISGGSVALLTGANTFGAASAIQGTAAAITAPWPVKLTDSVDSAMIDSASRQHVVLSDGASAFGIPGSPLSQTGEGQKIWWGGSLLTLNQINMSSSVSGCTRIVASTSGQAIVVVAATFTTSSCQFIGWIASGAGAASAAIQTAMPFGTNGGMDANRMPHGWLWSFPSGSNAIVTTTSACNVAGTIQYLNVAS